MTNIGFSGSRSWHNPNYVKQIVKSCFDTIHKNVMFPTIHVGDATGVDLMVVEECIAREWPVVIWGAYKRIRHAHEHLLFIHSYGFTGMYPEDAVGERGYLIRDEHLAENVDMLYAIWNGESRGTIYTYQHAKKSEKKAHLLLVDDKMKRFEIKHDY